MKNILFLILIFALVGLYACLELFNVVPGVRQALLAPILLLMFVFSFIPPFTHAIFAIGQTLDVDHWGAIPILFRIFAFTIISLALLAPWNFWINTRKRKHLILGIAVLLLYLFSCGGFIFIIFNLFSGMD